MSRDANVLDPPRTRKGSTLGLGSLTQRFFLKGDEQEANGYETAVLDDPPVGSSAEFDSFDKIPRKRRALFAVMALASMVMLGALTWKSFGALWRGNAWVQAASRAMVRAAPPTTAAEPQAPLFTPGVAAEPARPTQESADEIMSTDEAAPPEPIARLPEPPAADGQPNRAVHEPGEETDEAKPVDVPDPALTKMIRRSRSHALRGYVWSPAANALVPVDRAIGKAAPKPSNDGDAEQDVGPQEEPRVAPETTTPPPFKPKPTANDAPILE